MLVLGIDVGTKNLGMCVVRTGTDFPRILHWGVVCLKGPTPQCITEALHNVPLVSVDRCVIERQPVKNPTMCRMQHYLEMYWTTRNVDVTVQDARAKLTYAMGTTWWRAENDVSTYYQRKRSAVDVVGAFLRDTEQDDPTRDIFHSAKKKDDLADSLLHALAYAAKSAGNKS